MPVDELSDRALLTLEEARLYVLRNANDQSRDELLIDTTNDVSDEIWDHCEREFRPTGEAEARVFSYDGSGVLDLRPFDLRSLDELVMYTDLDAGLHDELAASEYRLEPRGGSRGGTYLQIQLPRPTIVEASPGFGWQVTVTGDWGMETIPGGVKLACKQWVENLMKNPGSFASNQMSGYNVVPELDLDQRRAGMPPAVRHRLARWKRRDTRTLSSVRLAHPSTACPGSTLPTV